LKLYILLEAKLPNKMYELTCYSYIHRKRKKKRDKIITNFKDI